ncbi:MAG: glycosyl hydrolase family protein [Deltaproteobacteria bacterium]|nr:glycosyl hydrolase family protein [Deltaproteobacteria bacterium]
MNLFQTTGYLQRFAFRALRAVAGVIPGGRISAFGTGEGMIGKVLIVNLDREPRRLRRTLRELSRFRTSGGAPLTSITSRLSAVDARDGRAVAATLDVDSIYRVGDQLYVQPDTRLAECFDAEEPIRMTPQEVAIARSHVEVWKAIATGSDHYVLVLEDDVWFRRGAARAIDRGWHAALQRCHAEGGPRLLYLSFEDAGGTAERADVCDALFRPKRGLWFLSGYVLSRDGAATLLRAMPVVGPVDMWINYRFEELRALALSSPVILQRPDSVSSNSYSILPFLARAGIVDARSDPVSPGKSPAGPVLAWTAVDEHEGLAMALSMLGLRVRAFDGDEKAIQARDLPNLFEDFDALVDAPLAPDALSATIARTDAKFVLETNAPLRHKLELARLPSSRIAVLPPSRADVELWKPLCALLCLAQPVQTFPVGAPRSWRIFRDDRPGQWHASILSRRKAHRLDDSPWVLPPGRGWDSKPPTRQPMPLAGRCLLHAAMTGPTPFFTGLVETFPGNLASFAREGLMHDKCGSQLAISKTATGNRPYRSGAFASVDSFQHGRFEAEIKAARGSGLVTGFFLHRGSPRQEIDVELPGSDVRSMLVNVFFNPGDDGAAIGFGYRGSPCRIDLGFDATLDFHLYAIDWRPGRITWSVDDRIVHERVGWDPTPLPHLPMRLHANLWAPRSEELAGRIDDDALPATATFKNVAVRT